MIVIEEAKDEGGSFIGWRLTVGNDRILVFADQVAMPGFRDGRDFYPRFDGHVNYAKVGAFSVPTGKSGTGNG